MAEQIPALLPDRSNKPGTKSASAHTHRAPAEARMDPGARAVPIPASGTGTLAPLNSTNISSLLQWHLQNNLPLFLLQGQGMGPAIIAADAISIAMSLQQAMFKGQPRETSQGSSGYETTLQMGKQKPTPLQITGRKHNCHKELGMRYSSKGMLQPIQSRGDGCQLSPGACVEAQWPTPSTAHPSGLGAHTQNPKKGPVHEVLQPQCRQPDIQRTGCTSR